MSAHRGQKHRISNHASHGSMRTHWRSRSPPIVRGEAPISETIRSDRSAPYFGEQQLDMSTAPRRSQGREGKPMIKRSKLLIGLAAVAIVVSACGGSGTPTASSGTKLYTIGYSNGGGVGNGFREEQLCTARAQALVSGQVSKLTVTSRNTDAAGQLSDIRDLIAKGVNAIVFNPNDAAALNPALAEAKAAGIVTVAVDANVTDPNTYNLYNNQVKYAELGAKWLFDQLGGTGTVYYMRGIAGHPADNDRDTGLKNMLKNYPNIKIAPTADGVATGWDPATATKVIND